MNDKGIGKTLCRHWIHGDQPLDSSTIGYMETVIGYMDAAMGYIDGRGIQLRYPIVYVTQFPKYPIAVSNVSH